MEESHRREWDWEEAADYEYWEEDRRWAAESREREVAGETGYDPTLQESRGRGHRAARRLDRLNDPDVQERRREYERSGEYPPDPPAPEMREGSQRWRRLKDLEKDLLNREREILEEKEADLRARTEQQQDMMFQMKQMQKMQEEQQELLRGLRESQRASSSAAPASGLKESPAAASEAAPGGLKQSQGAAAGGLRQSQKANLTPARPYVSPKCHDASRMDEKGPCLWILA